MPLALPTALLVAAAALLPGVSGQDDGPSEEEIREEILSKAGVPITFYGHVFDVDNDSPMPMNTQFPVNEDDLSRGYGGSCGTRAGVPLGGSCDTDATTVNFWYTTAGFVQVKNSDEWGADYGKFHNERGQTKDIYFDTAQTINARYFMSADFQGWPVAACGVACVNWDPGVIQDWVVEAWVWHASLGNWSSDPSAKPDMGPIIARSDKATLVAHGASAPQTMQSFDGTIPVVGSQTVYPFDIELAFDPAFVSAGGSIPYENNLIVEYQWYQLTEGDKYILLSPQGTAWNVNTGEDYPPSITFPVRNPMDVELVYPRFVHDKLVVLAIINTPWGSYDIDTEKTILTVKDANGNAIAIPEDLLKANVDSSVAHGGHYKPINATWIWDYQEQGLAPGDYTVTVQTTNFQNSHTTATTASFTVGADGVGGATGVGRGGLQSFDQGEFETFQDAAGGDVDVSTTPAAEEKSDKGSPGAGLALSAAAVAVALIVLRRRSA